MAAAAMSENRDAFGPLLRQLQVEMRSLKADVRALREEMGSRAYASMPVPRKPKPCWRPCSGA